MNDTCIIQGGTLATEAGLKRADILVQEGCIAEIGTNLPADGTPVLPAEGLVAVPGLVDVHVHFREPGFPEKETIRTGSLAAAHGGYTAVCAMPNLNPAPDSPETLAIEQSLIDRDAVIDVFPYAAITRGRAGLEPVDMAALKGLCIAFSDDGSGVQDAAVMRSAMQLAVREDCLIVAHCEDLSQPTAAEMEWRQIERDLALAAETGCLFALARHFCIEGLQQGRLAASYLTNQVNHFAFFYANVNIAQHLVIALADVYVLIVYYHARCLMVSG